MASLSKDKGGLKRITFNALNGSGKQSTIRLGKVSLKAAQSFKVKVESLLEAKLTRQPIETETSHWVAELPDKMLVKLSNVGLVNERERKADTLASLIDRFTKQADVKLATMAAYRQSTTRFD